MTQPVQFRAYPSKLQALVVLASMLPIVSAGTLMLPLGHDAPIWIRVVGVLILIPILVLMLGRLGALFSSSASVEIGPDGILSRPWSNVRIPWADIERWQVKNYLGSRYITIWLREPSSHRPSSINGLLNSGNRILGFGHLTLNAGGTNRRFEELQEAISAYMPKSSAAR